LTSSTGYRYKVRSFSKIGGKVEYGAFIEIKTSTRPTTPSLKIFSQKKKANLSWKKVSRAKGYEIYKYNNKNRKYYLKKVIKSGSTTKFIDSNLKKGTHRYIIRSYSVNNKVKVYSSFSSVKTIKVK
jgi:hypothetical protein